MATQREELRARAYELALKQTSGTIIQFDAVLDLAEKIYRFLVNADNGTGGN